MTLRVEGDTNTIESINFVQKVEQKCIKNIYSEKNFTLQGHSDFSYYKFILATRIMVRAKTMMNKVPK